MKIKPAVLLLTAAAAAALITACSPSSEPSGEVGRGSAGGEAVEIVAGDQYFEPAALELQGGSEVTVEVTNEGDMPHDFSIDALGINTGTIEPGEVATATFTVPEGTTGFVCSYHDGMSGEIRAE